MQSVRISSAPLDEHSSVTDVIREMYPDDVPDKAAVSLRARVHPLVLHMGVTKLAQFLSEQHEDGRIPAKAWQEWCDAYLGANKEKLMVDPGLGSLSKNIAIQIAMDAFQHAEFVTWDMGISCVAHTASGTYIPLPHVGRGDMVRSRMHDTQPRWSSQLQETLWQPDAFVSFHVTDSAETYSIDMPDNEMAPHHSLHVDRLRTIDCTFDCRIGPKARRIDMDHVFSRFETDATHMVAKLVRHNRSDLYKAYVPPAYDRPQDALQAFESYTKQVPFSVYSHRTNKKNDYLVVFANPTYGDCKIIVYSNAHVRLLWRPSVKYRASLKTSLHGLDSCVLSLVRKINDTCGGISLTAFGSSSMYFDHARMMLDQYVSTVTVPKRGTMTTTRLAELVKLVPNMSLQKRIATSHKNTSSTHKFMFRYHPSSGQTERADVTSIAKAHALYMKRMGASLDDIRASVRDVFGIRGARQIDAILDGIDAADEDAMLEMKTTPKSVLFWIDIDAIQNIQIQFVMCYSEPVKRFVVQVVSMLYATNKETDTMQLVDAAPSPDTDASPDAAPDEDVDDITDAFDDLDLYDLGGGAAAPEFATSPTGIQDDHPLAFLKSRNKVKYINVLKEADPLLFNYSKSSKNRGYTRGCQNSTKEQKQPVVLSKAEKNHIDAHYRNSYSIAYKTGSSPEKCEENFYICPTWWCVENRVALSTEDVMKLKSNGYKCPKGVGDVHADELPMYVHGNENEGSIRYPHGLPDEITPDGKVIPCCYREKPPPEDPGRLKKYIDQIQASMARSSCNDAPAADTDDSQPIPTPSPVPTPSVIKKDYVHVMGYDTAMSEREMGTLHNVLGGFLNKNAAGCSGLIKKNTSCYVRVGVTPVDAMRQSYMRCMYFLLWRWPYERERWVGVPNATQDFQGEVERFIEFIASNLPVHNYIMLNNGESLKRYYNPSDRIEDPAVFERFKGWFGSDSHVVRRYVDQYGLAHVRDALQGMTTYDATAIKDARTRISMLREFYIYNSYSTFVAYIRSDVPKHHHDLMNLFHPSNTWINKAGVYVAVVQGVSEEELSMACDPVLVVHPSAGYGRVCMVYQCQDAYEPVQYMHSHSKHGKVFQTYQAWGEGVYTDVVHKMAQQCGETVGVVAHDVIAVLDAIQRFDTVQHFVLDYAMSVVGAVTSGDVYVPFPVPTPCGIMQRGSATAQVMYITDIVGLLPYEDDVVFTYERLREHPDMAHVYTEYQMLERYAMVTVVHDGNAATHIVPVRINDQDGRSLFQDAYLDESIFVGDTSDPSSPSSPQPYHGPTHVFDAFMRWFKHEPYFQNELRGMFVRPVEDREAAIADMIRTYRGVMGIADTTHRDDIALATRKLASTDVQYLIHPLKNGVKVHDDEMFFYQEDIDAGDLLRRYEERVNNPYRRVTKATADYVLERSFRHVVWDEVRETMGSATWSPLSSSYVFTKSLKEQGFEIMKVPKQRDCLVKCANAVASLIGAPQISRAMLDTLAKKNLHTMHASKGDWTAYTKALRELPLFKQVLSASPQPAPADVLAARGLDQHTFTIDDVAMCAEVLGTSVLLVGSPTTVPFISKSGIREIHASGSYGMRWTVWFVEMSGGMLFVHPVVKNKQALVHNLQDFPMQFKEHLGFIRRTERA